MLKTRRYVSAQSTNFSTAAKFLPTVSVKCSVRAVILPSREPGMCMLCHLIYFQVEKSTYLTLDYR